MQMAARRVSLINSPITGQQFPSLAKTSGKEQRHDGEATTFRSDYQPPPKEYSAAKQIEPLPPASVIHKNACFAQIEGSLTQDTYGSLAPLPEHRPPTRRGKPVPPPSATAMYATNFRMDAERRLETHCTTSRDGYQPVPVESLQKERYRGGKLSNPGPLGNRAYGCPVQSEYSTSFISEPLRHVSSLGSCGWLKEEKGLSCNTITGEQVPVKTSRDQKGPGWYDMNTTHSDTFKGDALRCTNPPSKTARLQQLQTTSIPQGDRSKTTLPVSNHQDSFQPLEVNTSRATYDKPKAVGAILHSSIHYTNHTSPPAECFSTTATDTYRKFNNLERMVPLIRFPRNTSFLPRGDLDAARERKRMNYVTTKRAHPRPPLGSYPEHVDASNLHTRSSVHLGAPSSRQCLLSNTGGYSSTMAESYPPISAPVERVRAPSRDNIPLNYYPGHLCRSTTAASYSPHVSVQLDKPNPVALENLKRSHWKPPHLGPPSYSTTHQDCFSAPSISQHVE